MPEKKISPGRDWLTDSLHVFVLAGFAIAQPLFSVLSKGPTFFVARRSEPVDVILLAVILCIGLPAVIVLGEFLIGLANRTARKRAHFCVVAILLTILVLPVVKRLDWIPGIVCVIGAITFGLVAAGAYYRFTPVRALTTVLSPTILVFPILFLCHGPVSEVVWRQSEGEESSSSIPQVTIRNPVPIVFIVFDEFSTVSLMDEQRQIDPIRYPHLAAFAKEATWFRNMTTVSPWTIGAVPALLTGKYPDKLGKPPLPTLRNHPVNLFTLLEKSHDVRAFEMITQLCPPEGGATMPERMRAMASDLWVVYRHIMVPRSLVRDGFPDITAQWNNFRGREPNRVQRLHIPDWHLTTRVLRWRKIVASFQPMPESRPPLYYVHLLLPHVPYLYLPSTELYAEGDGRVAATVEKGDRKVWTEDERIVAREHQRYLLQVGCTDTLVGELMDHLKRVGLYEDALIVLAADHGVCFRPGESRRCGLQRGDLSGANKVGLATTMSIPLLIKAPHQKIGAISDRNVESIDVLPTIAGILGMELHCPVDGNDALDPLAPERLQKTFYSACPADDPKTRAEDGRIIVDASFQQMYEALDRKLRLFGSGRNPAGLYQLEPHDRLVARPKATSTLR